MPRRETKIKPTGRDSPDDLKKKFSPWLLRCEDDANFCICRACQCRMTCNRPQKLERHQSTAKHIRNLKIMLDKEEKNRQIRKKLRIAKVRQDRCKYSIRMDEIPSPECDKMRTSDCDETLPSDIDDHFLSDGDETLPSDSDGEPQSNCEDDPSSDCEVTTIVEVNPLGECNEPEPNPPDVEMIETIFDAKKRKETEKKRKALLRFITMYHELPVLWNRRHRDYRNRIKREKAFKAMLPVFQLVKPGAVVKDVKKKINSLRTNYQKELRKGVADKPSWTFSQLGFLRKHLENPLFRNYSDSEDERNNKCNSFGEDSFRQEPHKEGHHFQYAKAIVSKAAPHFEGSAVIKRDIAKLSLTEYAGKYLVIIFYPLDFTLECSSEIIPFSDRIAEFRKLNTAVIACSVDSHFTHLAWINTPRKEGGLGNIEIPLLSDLSHKIGKDYGVYLNDLGHTLRGLFIIDQFGVLRHISMNDLTVGGRSVDETLRLVRAFQKGDVGPGWQPEAETVISN